MRSYNIELIAKSRGQKYKKPHKGLDIYELTSSY